MSQTVIVLCISDAMAISCQSSDTGTSSGAVVRLGSDGGEETSTGPDQQLWTTAEPTSGMALDRRMNTSQHGSRGMPFSPVWALRLVWQSHLRP